MTRRRAKVGSTETQAARQSRSGATRREFGFLGLFDQSYGAVVEVAARFSWRQAMRRTQQQPHAKAIFELRNRLRNGGLADMQLLGGTGKRAGVDNADEGLHRGEFGPSLLPLATRSM